MLAAALSIPDPRERPADREDAARQKHARFADEHSDFVSFLNLWRYLGEQRKSLSGNAFRRMCREDFLHYLRIREWQDLTGQLRGILARDHLNDGRGQLQADINQVHLPTHVGPQNHTWLERPERHGMVSDPHLAGGVTGVGLQAAG